MLKIFGVFLTGPGMAYTPLAFFSRESTAQKYIEMRRIYFPHERLKIEIWSLDDIKILDDLRDEAITNISR